MCVSMQVENKTHGGFPLYEHNNNKLFYENQNSCWRANTQHNTTNTTYLLSSLEGSSCPYEMGTFWQFGNETTVSALGTHEVTSLTCKTETTSTTTTGTSTATTRTTTTETSPATTRDVVSVENCQNVVDGEDEETKLLISTLQELVEQLKDENSPPKLPSGMKNATSSEDLKSLEPPSEAQDKEEPKRFVFEEMKDFSPKGSFGFLAVNSSYKAIFPQRGGTEVKSILLVTLIISEVEHCLNSLVYKGGSEDGDNVSEQCG